MVRDNSTTYVQYMKILQFLVDNCEDFPVELIRQRYKPVFAQILYYDVLKVYIVQVGDGLLNLDNTDVKFFDRQIDAINYFNKLGKKDS